MAQKFITTRELNFIKSVTRELTQDVSRQYILYYGVDPEASTVHDVYDESIVKVMLDPVKLFCRVEYDQVAATTGRGILDSNFKLTVEVQPQELLDRNIEPQIGHFVEWGQVIFEITNVTTKNPAYGQANAKVTVELTCYPSRESQYKAENSSIDGIDNTHPVEAARPRTLGDKL